MFLVCIVYVWRVWGVCMCVIWTCACVCVGACLCVCSGDSLNYSSGPSLGSPLGPISPPRRAQLFVSACPDPKGWPCRKGLSGFSPLSASSGLLNNHEVAFIHLVLGGMAAPL